MLLQEQNMTLMVKERKNCHSVLGKFFDQLPKGNSLASGDGFWVQLTAVMRVLFRLITSRLEICVLSGIVILEGPQNKANRDSCLSHQFFPISVISFLKGECKTLLNTQEENLTVNIESVTTVICGHCQNFNRFINIFSVIQSYFFHEQY